MEEKKKMDPRFQFVSLHQEESEHIAAPQYSYWKSVFRRFFSSKPAILMLIISGLIVVLSILQPMISGYDPLRAGVGSEIFYVQLRRPVFLCAV